MSTALCRCCPKTNRRTPPYCNQDQWIYLSFANSFAVYGRLRLCNGAVRGKLVETGRGAFVVSCDYQTIPFSLLQDEP